MYLLPILLSVLTLSIGHLIRRQSLLIPEICQKICDYAVLVAEVNGTIYSQLCPSTASFQTALSSCFSCVTDYKGDSTQSVEEVLTGLNIYIDLCSNSSEAPAATALLAIASNASVSIASAAASLSSASAANAASIASLDSLAGITPSSTSSSLSRSRPSSPPVTGTTTASTAAPTSSPVHSSHTGTIIGAAVGGSVGGLLLLALVTRMVIIRRKRHHKTLATARQEKPQLHSDDFQPRREELEGTAGKKNYDHTTMSELPSTEPVVKATELPDNKVVGAELDNEAKDI